jgi:hypothetical protein
MKRRGKRGSSRSGRSSSRKSSRRDKGRSSSRRNKRRFQKDQLMNRMKKSQQQAEGGRGVIRGDVELNFWRPKDGTHMIDIIPYQVGKYNVDGDEPGAAHYTFRYFLHRQVGAANAWVICPLKTWGKDCPICEERQRLIDKGADWEKVIKPLFPKERYIYNIVCYDRGEEKKGVQVWDVSNHYFQKHIITLSKRPSRGGREEKQILFFDEEDGKNISFTIEPAKSKDDFAEYVGHAFEDRDYDIPDEIFDSAHCLDEIVQIHSYSEIEKMFFGRDGRGSGNDDDDPRGDGDFDLDALLDDLDEVEDNDELEDFCEDNDIEVKLRASDRAFDRNVKKVKQALEDMAEEENAADDADDFPDYTADDIEEMNFRKLKKIIRDQDLSIDPDDFEDDEIDDLRDEIIEELGLEDD